MLVLETIGISRPETLFGFGIRSIETLPAVFRAEIMRTLVIP
jgi:hypothetical protein